MQPKWPQLKVHCKCRGWFWASKALGIYRTFMHRSLAKSTCVSVEHRSIAWDVLGVQCIFVCLNGWVNVWVRVAGPLGWFVPSSCSIIFRSLVTWALGPQVLWIEEITLVFCGWWWLIYMSTIYVLWAQRYAFIQFSSLLDTHIFHFASQTLTPSSERLYKVAALALEMTGKYIPMWILAYF